MKIINPLTLNTLSLHIKTPIFIYEKGRYFEYFSLLSISDNQTKIVDGRRKRRVKMTGSETN